MAGSFELQNQTPGRRAQTWCPEARVWMSSFSSPTPLLNLPASPFQGLLLCLCPLWPKTGQVHTLVWLCPHSAPWAQA